jgi:hypothetical protein
MEYFIIEHAVDTEETGSTDMQVIWKNPHKLKKNPLLIINSLASNEYPPDEFFPFDYLELNKGAKLSDLMSSPFYNGFIVSDKLKSIFENSNIKSYKFYDIKLLHKRKEVKGYYYFHSASCLKDKIDFAKTKFYIGNLLGNRIRDLNIELNSAEEVVELQKTLKFGEEVIWPKYFYLSNSFPFSLDLFRLCVHNYSIFISKKLKQIIEENNITGVDIKSATDLIKTPNLA